MFVVGTSLVVVVASYLVEAAETVHKKVFVHDLDPDGPGLPSKDSWCPTLSDVYD